MTAIITKFNIVQRVSAFALLFVVTGCSSFFADSAISTTQTGSGQQALISSSANDSNEGDIGLREHPRILSNYGGVYSNRKAEIMLARIVGRLLTAANQADTKFTVTILDTPDVNAFALPGGYIYVTRGILALANDASELAAVLAHEIAHVTLRHARARSNRVRTSAIVDRVITGVLGGNIDTDQTAARSRVSLAAFSQAQELAADKEGVLIAGRARYEPKSAAQFLSSMGRYGRFVSGEEQQSDDFLSSHPSTPDRINKAIESALAFEASEPLERGRKDYMAAIEGLQFGISSNQGAIVGRQFIHPILDFTFIVPKSYRLENSGGSVVGVAGDGEALRFDSAQVPENMPLTDYLQSGWIAGLLPETVKTLSHNGVEMAGGEARTEHWVFQVTAVRYKSDVYRFIFAARKKSVAFEAAARDTIASFRSVQKSDLRKIRTSSVKIIVAKSGDTIAKLAAKMGGVADAKQLFLVLNNLYQGDPLEPGKGYKIVTLK